MHDRPEMVFGKLGRPIQLFWLWFQDIPKVTKSELSDNSRCDAFVFVIMSHGNQLRKDDYGLNGMVKECTDTHIQSIYRKPKLFFIQACQQPGNARPLFRPLFVCELSICLIINDIIFPDFTVWFKYNFS